MIITKKLISLLPLKTVYAHCDVPCGIYDPRQAQIAAETVVKMVEKIESLPKENPTVEDRNNFVRYVWTKEEHSRILKHELTVLWADFFKPEHLEILPDLHDTFWKTLKLASTCKQHVDMQAALELKTAVDKIADMFARVKQA